MRRLLWFTLMPLAGCDQLFNTYEDITAPVVVQGLALGMEPPSDASIDLSSSEFGQGASVTVFLATAEEAQNIDQAPVTDGEVALTGPSIGEVAATNLGEGAYQMGPDPDIDYVDGAVWTITAITTNDTSTAAVTLPPAAAFTVPQQHSANTAITIDLVGQGYTDALVVVFDNATGSATYDNRPNGIRELYDRSRNNEEIASVEIPATAFPNQSVYAIGVAGLNHTTSEDLEFFNTLLSSVVAGKMRFTGVSTIPAP